MTNKHRTTTNGIPKITIAWTLAVSIPSLALSHAEYFTAATDASDHSSKSSKIFFITIEIEKLPEVRRSRVRRSICNSAIARHTFCSR
jgi:hypothetical protein